MSLANRVSASEHRNRLSFLIALSCVLVSGCRESFDPTAPALSKSTRLTAPSLRAAAVRDADRRIHDEYIVVFDNSVEDVHGRAAALTAVSGGYKRFTFSRAIKGFSAHMSPEAAAAISKHPGVAFVEQDQEVSIGEAQTNATWALDRIDQSAMPLDGLYNYATSGAGVNVYIVDTGIRGTHTQFGGRVSPSFSSIGDAFGTEGCQGHGTHVAGIVGGSTFGVAKDVRLYSVRVLDCNGDGTISGVIAGVDWITANRTLPAVANMSLTGSISLALNEAVQTSINSGVTYAVASGNATSDACSYSPASLPGALTVGATTSRDEMASYSNWGPCVDIYAPGSSVLSAFNYDDNSTYTLSGTSMAAPLVAGAAALYLQSHPTASPAEVSAALLANSTTGVVAALPGGSINRMLRVNGAGSVVNPPVVSPPPPLPTNSPPRPSFAVVCQKGNCSFDASASRDDQGISNYEWRFGDGSSSVGAGNPFATHAYTQRGSYSVTAVLTVTDVSGLKASVQKTIQIKNNGR